MSNAEDTDKYPTQPLPKRDAYMGDANETMPPTARPVEQFQETPMPSHDAAAYQAYTETVVNEEEIATPPPYRPVPITTSIEPPRRRPSTGCLGFLVGLSLVISLASLALTALIINAFVNVQQVTVQGLDTAVAALDNLEGEGFHYEYQFQRTIPVSASIPIQQDMIFPFDGDFPINTTVRVPVDAGILGTYVIDVPINTSVHVQTEVPVHIDQMFDISTTIPMSMSIPIDVRPDDPAIQQILGGLRAWLGELRETLDIHLLPTAGQ